jgi:hypothetical protein
LPPRGGAPPGRPCARSQDRRGPGVRGPSEGSIHGRLSRNAPHARTGASWTLAAERNRGVPPTPECASGRAYAKTDTRFPQVARGASRDAYESASRGRV